MRQGNWAAYASALVSVWLVAGCATPIGEDAGLSTDQQAIGQADESRTAARMVSVDTLIEAPEDFAIVRIDTDEYPVPPWAKYLTGVRICLDPGHGGEPHRRGYKRGPTGVREAEVNLRVAKYLRDFLVNAGADVLLTRDEDVALSLEERAEIANEWPADLFISCHHNAIGNKPKVNRTSVWYHRDVDHRPSNLDLARYLCQGLYDALAFPQITGVPLKSDQLMYASGFGLLRRVEVTAALLESSFFTNPEQEQRLRDPHHNLDEAYGVFIGLARYAAGGIPRVALVSPVEDILSGDPPFDLEFKLDDGLRSRKSWGAERQMILSDSIVVRLNGVRIPHAFTNDGYGLAVELPDGLEPGRHQVEVQFQNMFKNSVINPHFEIILEP